VEFANLTKNQESQKRIVETKFHGLDVKVTELTTTVDSLKKEVDDAKLGFSIDDEDVGTGLPMTTQF
jgi:hypothetical protein